MFPFYHFLDLCSFRNHSLLMFSDWVCYTSTLVFSLEVKFTCCSNHLKNEHIQYNFYIHLSKYHIVSHRYMKLLLTNKSKTNQNGALWTAQFNEYLLNLFGMWQLNVPKFCILS